MTTPDPSKPPESEHTGAEALALGALDGVPDTALIQSRQGQVRALLKASL